MYFYLKPNLDVFLSKKKVAICQFPLLFTLKVKPQLKIVNFQLEKQGTVVNLTIQIEGLSKKRGQFLSIRLIYSPWSQLIYNLLLEIREKVDMLIKPKLFI